MIDQVCESSTAFIRRTDPAQQNHPVHSGFRKCAVKDLALFGGPALFAEPLHVGRPNIPDRAGLFERFNSILSSGRLTNDGPLVREFERRVASHTGVKHCIATSSGTMALQILARALELTGEVILPSLTFIASAHALHWIGLQPVFADVDPGTWCIDPASVESLISPQTSAILGVHLWGRPCDQRALGRLTDLYGLKLLFDGAHAFGCSHGGVPVGNFGDAEVFSFHATKFVQAGEGGAIVTNDSGLADRARRLRNFGFTAVDTVSGPGINGRMNEFSAAVGLSSLDQIDRIRAVNQRNLYQYRDELAAVPGIHVMDFDPSETNNWQYVVLEIHESRSGIDRDLLARLLQAEGVLARRYFLPGCHRAEPYRLHARNSLSGLRNTDNILKRVLTLPNGLSISTSDVRAVCGLIQFAVRNAGEIQRQLEAEQQSSLDCHRLCNRSTARKIPP